MENASKALLIAGAILLVMLIIGLLIFSWSKFSEFYSKNDELDEIENISKFNLQFKNYEKRDVYGYELISLANKVADYNMRYSNASEAQNDEKYKKITMKINLQNQKEAFCKHSTNTLFVANEYTIEGIQNIIDKAENIEYVYGSSNATTKLAKSIDSLILSDTQLKYNRDTRHMTDSQSKMYALETYNRLTDKDKIENYKKDNTKVESDYNQMVGILKGPGDLIKYYEYYQFKRGIFNCTGITYDDAVSGRVDSISFNFTGKIE